MSDPAPAEILPGSPSSGLLLIADHASNRVPPGIDLGIAPQLMDEHIALDIGIGPLSRAVAARLGCPAILATISRLVVDLHRRADEPGAIPAISDGHAVPGNAIDHEARMARIERFWTPYHALIETTVDELGPHMLFALHSFTPRLATRPEEERPWHVGILYNHDDRAARLAIEAFRRRGIPTGDNEPYSGKLLNATMDRHAEARGLPYLCVEIRQDLIADEAGVPHWAPIVADVVAEVRDGL